MERMLQTFQSDLETLRKQHEDLKARIEQSRGTSESTVETENLVPIDVGADTVFQVLGTPPSLAGLGLNDCLGEGPEVSTATASYTTTSPGQTRVSSIFGRQTAGASVKGGKIFKRASEPGPEVTTPREEQAGIQGSVEGLVAPPTTPTSGFLPMVQPVLQMPSPPQLSVSTATQAPTSESAYSENLDVIPEAIQAPAVSEMVPKLPKTYLIPWDMNAPPYDLSKIVRWILETVYRPEDYVKILISGELPGEETREGEISHLFGNDIYDRNRSELRSQFPLLSQMIEMTGLDKIPFQIEIRRGESLGWSLRSEFQWPHVNEQLVVVVPSHGAQNPTFEQFVLGAAPCSVIECPVRY